MKGMLAASWLHSLFHVLDLLFFFRLRVEFGLYIVLDGVHSLACCDLLVLHGKHERGHCTLERPQ